MSLSTSPSSVRVLLHISQGAKYSSGAFLNDTLFPDDFNFIDPPVRVYINGLESTTSQRFHVSGQLNVS